MTFYYHMYGASIGTLSVRVNQTVLWQLSGEQGNAWYKATVPLHFTGVSQVCDKKRPCALTSHGH